MEAVPHHWDANSGKLHEHYTKLSSYSRRHEDSRAHLWARHVEPERQVDEMKPKPVRKDLVEIPAEITEKHHDIELCMDTMFVNECGMLTAIEDLDEIPAEITEKHHDIELQCS